MRVFAHARIPETRGRFGGINGQGHGARGGPVCHKMPVLFIPELLLLYAGE